jgi:hypothetical protein
MGLQLFRTWLPVVSGRRNKERVETASQLVEVLEILITLSMYTDPTLTTKDNHEH